PSQVPQDKRVTILGAGLAGCSMAHHLAKRGWEVHVLDRAKDPASGASGNRGGILFPYFSAHHDPMSQYYWSGFFHILREWRELSRQGKRIAGEQPGLIFLEQKAGDGRRFKKIVETFSHAEDLVRAVSSQEASALFGNPLERGGLFLKAGAWLRPPDLCRAWLDHPAIHFHGEHALERLEFQEGWGPFHTPVLILANAWEAAQYPQTQWLPLAKARGQVTYLPSPGSSLQGQCLLSFGGYWIPLPEGGVECGATFERSNTSEEILKAGHQKNLNQVKKFMGIDGSGADLSQLDGRVGFRTLTHDRWPVVGPVSPEKAFLKTYPGLGHGRKSFAKKPPYREGLFLHTAHGSKGLLSTSLASELLASHLNGEPLPLPQKILAALHPSRFLVKKAKIGSH
ncbi:MAG: FAD-dependent 5-carboxymethylaminomethyl-2-thiouridine(34) oxidoreductase MnmC, partial [bacterium]|nr:FAD-dependent 5-carboxymethylaminomethyl-2-thiouridine(34) oxidoreductase MnmC [bacterium]